MKVEATLSVWVEEFGRRFETPVAKLPPAVMERIQSDQVSVRTRAGWLVWETLFRQERHDSCQKDLVAAYAGLAQAEAAVQQAGLDAQTAERKHRGALDRMLQDVELCAATRSFTLRSCQSPGAV